jgi:molybdate transport system substrate-binding protein
VGLRGIVLVYVWCVWLLFDAAAFQAHANELRVAAAADLTKAFTEIGSAYQKRTGVHVALTFGASGILTKQIENGAPFDLFAAANTAYIDELQKRELVLADDVHIYAVGHIGLFVRKGAPAPPAAIVGLADPRYEHIAIANPKVAPYGKAAQEALEAAHVWEAVQPRLVQGENIQQTLQFAQTGNADIAVVSASLGRAAGGQFVAIPDKLHQPLNQAIGVIKSSPNLESARKFAAFVLGKEGRAILKKYSFSFQVEQRGKSGRQ